MLCLVFYKVQHISQSSSSLQAASLPALAATFHWPAEVTSDMQSAEVQQQCVHVLGVLTTMLAVLQSDTEHVYQEFTLRVYIWICTFSNGMAHHHSAK